MVKEVINKVKDKIGKEPQISVIVKNRYQEVKKWYKNSYFVILFITIGIIVVNYDVLFSLIFKADDVEINGPLPLILTVGLFILIVVPVMSIFTRKKCPHCHEIVFRNAEICHKCGCELKLHK